MALASADELAQIRLFLEEICSDLVRFHHVEVDRTPAEAVRVHREYFLGRGSYADLRVDVPGIAPYFVEILFAYTKERLLSTIARKYASLGSAEITENLPAKLILVLRTEDLANGVEAQLRASIDPRLALEVWTEDTLCTQVQKYFDVTFSAFTGEELLQVREAIDRAKWKYAFGDSADMATHPLSGTLLWHFGTWRLRLLRERGRMPETVLEPGLHKNVVVLMADLCSFSSYVRDTTDDALIRNALTDFYSKTRYEVLNHGGLLYQFVGDEIIGIFGLPEADPGFVDDALACAGAIVDVGNSVSNGWQRHIDRVQKSAGVHVGMAIGDLNLMPLRPFSRRHISFIGDAINIAARLEASVGAGEIAISNGLYQRVSPDLAAVFEEMAPLDAKNMGSIRAWKRPSQDVGRFAQRP